jgi:SlyX protein
MISEEAWIDLQMRLAFQEDALQQMSQQVAWQGDELKKAQGHIVHLNQKINDLLTSLDDQNPIVDQRPPHY